jgi:imidazoleglycerol-phosphate dehydratase
MRSAEIIRKTNETQIDIAFNLDGVGKRTINTGIGFFDHMLDLFTFHGKFDLEITCKGDLEVDCHHSVEDTGLALGSAFRKAVGDNPRIKRFGTAYVPMDESLSRAVVDVSGRPYLILKSDITRPMIGDFDTDLVKEFFKAFVQEARINLHIETFYGENAHHMVESMFKAFSKALSEAVIISGNDVASTKGKL